jgi:protein CWC15
VRVLLIRRQSGSSQGAVRVHAPSRSISVRDIIGNAEMKTRAVEAPTEDREQLKRQLESKEQQTRAKREKTEGNEGAAATDPRQALEWLMAHDPDAEPKREADKEDDSSSGSGSDGDDDDDDDEEEELLRELEKIKRERADEAALKERAADEERNVAARDAAAHSNPLLVAASSQTVTKKWYEDTVFRNQAKNSSKEPKRFVNDTIRSDFHRKFLDRFVK